MNPEKLRAHADRIKAANVLGRSELMQRLFDFLVECTLQGKAPKEIEIAIDVFGKDTRFEVTRDAMVRVYMHKLRRKLEDYYASARDENAHDPFRLAIPRGEYRLVIEPLALDPPANEVEAATSEEVTTDSTPTTSPSPVSEPEPPQQSALQIKPQRRSGLWMGLAAAMIVLLGANLVVMLNKDSSRDELAAARDHQIWQQIVTDDLPVYIVIGDYYIFGELDEQSSGEPDSVKRLVREFNVNSRKDLEQLLKDHPNLESRYMDLALSYLPVSAAFALRDIAPVLDTRAKSRHPVQVITASELTPAMLKSSHIVYIGLISGMGILRDIAFAGSQLRIGDTYDELIDRKSGQIYVSQSSVSINDNTRYRDYGYVSTFAGPNNNRIVIVAGTRDVALMHVAETVSGAESLSALDARTKNLENFEALYAVDAIDRKNLDGKLLLADRVNMSNIWTSSTVAATSANGVVTLHAP